MRCLCRKKQWRSNEAVQQSVILRCIRTIKGGDLIRHKYNKVVTIMVIRPLDDPTGCAQSVVADLRPLCLEYVGIGMSAFGSPHMGSY